MATESPIRMLETRGKWASHKGAASMDEEALLVSGHKYHSGRSMVPNRSGSAPPNMEGSLAAIENLMQNSGLSANWASLSCDGEMRGPEGQLHSYSSSVLHYSFNGGLSAQYDQTHTTGFSQQFPSSHAGNKLRLTPLSGSSDNFFHLSRSTLTTHKEESEDDRSPEKASDDLTNRNSAVWSAQESSLSVGQTRSVTDLGKVQDEISHMSSRENEQSDTTCHVPVGDGSDNNCVNISSLHEESTNVTTSVAAGMSAGDMSSPLHADGAPSPLLRRAHDSGSLPSTQIEDPSSISLENKALDSSDSDISSLQSGMKALKISRPPKLEIHGGRMERQNNPRPNLLQAPIHQQSGNVQFQGFTPQLVSQGTNNSFVVANQFFHGGKLPSTEVQPVLHSSGFTPPLYATAAATYMQSASAYYTGVQPPGMVYPQYGMGGYPYNAGVLPPFLTGYPPHSAVPLAVDSASVASDVNSQVSGSWGSSSQGIDTQHMNKFYGPLGFTQPFVDPRMHFPQPFGDVYSAPGQVDPLALRGSVIGNQGAGGQGHASPRRGTNAGAEFPGSPMNMGYFVHIPNSPLPSPIIPGSPLGGSSLAEGRSDVNSPISNRSASLYPGWQSQRGFESLNYQKPFSFLEELKSGKGRRFDLSDITGHVAEFSVDQHGSRFIQQKLENCSSEDKAAVFSEVLPHASKLMTDVFGNYVIQKFFEYGTHDQRRDLAKALTGQIMQLSLQMYGCRVIQKALDVIELDQKVELVRELDGHVMRCVRDQNGNHVIQKCIECIPADRIGFIISAFRGQVAGLSMHPYGCRVIQRVLEHCTDELQSQFIVDEILESVCALAQDQYGNYVTQHVLERGKRQERSQIVKNLSGQVVQMSQHKFASNVVEKCLEYGDAASREILVSEVIGQNEGNDNLLVMMKDQYANYVVQKILEKCTDTQRDLLLGRMRVHLPALKKYTYGKHIVARFEQLYGEIQAPGP